MRVIIAGSRDITDLESVVRVIEESQFEITEVVSGTARGVDKMGEQWARAMGIPVSQFPANWDLYKKRAGRVRNREMAEYADALIAVWDGTSRGTAHMIEVMNELGKHVYVGRPSKWDKLRYSF